MTRGRAAYRRPKLVELCNELPLLTKARRIKSRCHSVKHFLRAVWRSGHPDVCNRLHNETDFIMKPFA